MKYNKYPKDDPEEASFIKRSLSGCSPVGLAIILIFFFVLTVVCSCTTPRYYPVETVRTEYIKQIEKDYQYVHDSIYIRSSGDTVFFEKWHTKIVNVLRVDSFIKRDSIPVPYEVEVIKQVEKNLTFWQSLKIEVGGIALAAILILLGYFVLRIAKSAKSVGLKAALKLIFKI